MEERVVATKAANALVENAEVNIDLVKPELIGVPAPPAFDHILKATLSAFAAHYGGLWVGGKVTLTTKRLLFQPNALNKAFHKGLTSLEVGLSQIVSVDVLPGRFTKIVLVSTPTHALKFRCYGAGDLVRKIQECSASARSEEDMEPT